MKTALTPRFKSLRLVSLCALLSATAAHADTPGVGKAYAKAGRLYVVGTTGKAAPLPGFSKVKDAVLSPDGTRIAFIKGTAGKAIPTGGRTGSADQLWLVDANGAHPTLLAAAKNAPDVKNILAGLTAPCFSPSGQAIYFLSQAYAVSDAVHVVDLRTRAVRFVCPGNTVEVVSKGVFKGDLIVQQHRYFAGGGTFDWYWIVDARGKDVNPIGTEAQLRQFQSDQ